MNENGLQHGRSVSVSIVAFMLMLPSGAVEDRLFAELVILNANVITVDEKNPRAEALAVRDEKLLRWGQHLKSRRS